MRWIRPARGALSVGIVMVLGVSVTGCTGDDRPAESPAAAASPSASSATQPTVKIDASLFRRAKALQSATKLDCPRDGFASVIVDRGVDPAAEPLLDPDPATDGLAALAERPAPERTRAMNPGWDDQDPPTPIFLFPREPQASMRGVIQFQTAGGQVVAGITANRDAKRGPWHVEEARWCSW